MGRLRALPAALRRRHPEQARHESDDPLADWILSRPNPPTGYHAKTNILAHASIYSGGAKCLSFAAYAVADFTDNLYQGSDPRYQGVSIPNHTNLHQSYFMQEVLYYLYALNTLGQAPSPAKLTRTSIRCLSREKVDGKETYVFHTRIRQKEEGPFTLSIPVRGYEKMSYTAILTPLGDGKELESSAKTEPLSNSVRILGRRTGDTAPGRIRAADFCRNSDSNSPGIPRRFRSRPWSCPPHGAGNRPRSSWHCRGCRS